MMAASRVAAAETSGMPAGVATRVRRSSASAVATRERTMGCSPGDLQEQLEGGEEGSLQIVGVGMYDPLDLVEEVVGRPQHAGLGEIVASAELVVDGLVADSGLAGDAGAP
jgi:hypothetical protein